MEVVEDSLDWDKTVSETAELKGKKAGGEEDYIIPSSLIQEIREQFLEKKQTFNRPTNIKRKVDDIIDDDEGVNRDDGSLVTFTPGAKPSFSSTSLIHKINAAQRENAKRKKEIDLEDEEERMKEKEKELPTLSARLPLAACGLSTATKKRCSDLCLRLIQQFSDVKNKADAEAISKLIAHSTETSDPSVVPASASVPTPDSVIDATLPLDASLPQAACQLLIHVTRDCDVRDHFDSMGGVRQLLTTIPPFDGTYGTLFMISTDLFIAVSLNV
jgi:hypothetical protein